MKSSKRQPGTVKSRGSKRSSPGAQPEVVFSAFALAHMFGFTPRTLRFEDPKKDDAGAGGAPELQQRIDKLEATITGLSATLRTLAKPAQKAADPDPEPTTSKERIEKLEKTLRDRDAADLENRRMGTITSAISAQGIADVAAEDLLAHVVHYHGKNLKAKGEAFVYEDPETGESMPVKEFLEKKILTGARRDRYLASGKQKGASADRGKGGSAGGERVFFSQLSPDVRAKMTLAERNAYVAEDLKRQK